MIRKKTFQVQSLLTRDFDPWLVLTVADHILLMFSWVSSIANPHEYQDDLCETLRTLGYTTYQLVGSGFLSKESWQHWLATVSMEVLGIAGFQRVSKETWGGEAGQDASCQGSKIQGVSLCVEVP